MANRLILASSSPARQQILQRIGVTFETVSPDIDETPLDGEPPAEYVQRLALNKAKEGAARYQKPGYYIGSDQICVVDQAIVGKPHTRENAVAHLQTVRGREITFYNGIALYDSETDVLQVGLDTVTVKFREYTDEDIEAYLDAEDPLKCAGAIKVEGLGITLIESLRAKDPNTLEGLPVIDLVEMLAQLGVRLFDFR